jgi:hypothetical protein
MEADGIKEVEVSSQKRLAFENENKFLYPYLAQAQIGETGLGGFSMSALMNQVMNETSQNVVRTGVNRDWSAAQIGREKDGIRSTAIGQMNSTTPGIRPSALAAGLQIAKSGLAAYSDYSDKTKTPKK